MNNYISNNVSVFLLYIVKYRQGEKMKNSIKKTFLLIVALTGLVACNNQTSTSSSSAQPTSSASTISSNSSSSSITNSSTSS